MQFGLSYFKDVVILCKTVPILKKESARVINKQWGKGINVKKILPESRGGFF
jgi:hypothetical protein